MRDECGYKNGQIVEPGPFDGLGERPVKAAREWRLDRLGKRPVKRPPDGPSTGSGSGSATDTPRGGGMFTALANHNYRIYLTGSFVSNIGTWMQRVAQDWLVL